MRKFTEVTLKVVVESPDVKDTRRLLIQAVDTIHEDNYVFTDAITQVEVSAPENASDMMNSDDDDAPEEPRIYVLLPEGVQVQQDEDGEFKSRYMVPGRLMAQGEHVTGLMRGCEYLYHGHDNKILINPITTINLSVRNSRELDFMQNLLIEAARKQETPTFRVYQFFDDGAEFYGTKNKVKTAVCTTPVLRSAIDAVIGHLELYEA